MGVCVLIIFFIVLLHYKNKKIKELQEEVKKLKSLVDITNNIIQDKKDENLNEVIASENTIEKEETMQIKQKPLEVKEKVEKPRKDKLSAEEKKNVTTLIAGSILVILSAIVFLTTAWNAIPNVIKTITVCMFAGIFLGASKIAKEKFQLEKTSKTFFYIAMAYLPICLVSISAFGLLGDYLALWGEGNNIYFMISSIILAVLYYKVSDKYNEKYLMYGSAFAQIFALCFALSIFIDDIYVWFIGALIYNLLFMFKFKNPVFKDAAKYIAIFEGCLLFFAIQETSASAMLSFLLMAINFLALESKQSHIGKAFAFNFFVLVIGYNLIYREIFNLSLAMQQICALIYVIAMFAIEYFKFKESKNILLSLRVLSLLSIGHIYLLSLTIKTVLIPSYIVGMLLIAMLIIDLKITKHLIYKYLAYTFINVIIGDINYNLFNNVDLTPYVLMITTVIIMIVEYLYSKDEDKILPTYLCATEIFALVISTYKATEISAFIAIAYVVAILIYNKKKSLDFKYNLVPLILLLPNIYCAKLDKNLEMGMMIVASAIFSYFSVKEQKVNVFTVFSIIYLGCGIYDFNNEYLAEILFIIWSGVHLYLFANDKEKDLFKICIIVGVTALYYSACTDLDLLKYTIIKHLGIIISGFIIIKNIVAKYVENQNTDTIEYIFWGLIYLSAVTCYQSSLEGIIFSILILGIIYLSYNKKYGATFLSSILAIIANGFILTKKFWLMIPWWIYLLVVGATLIAFAIKNEANENKITIGKVLKNIKESCEK